MPYGSLGHPRVSAHPQPPGMPVPACPQRPALGEVPAAPTRSMEEEEEEEAACDGEEPWLANSNNNAAPGGRPGARGVRPPGQEPSYLQRVLLEIVESERTYARDLRGIVEVGAPRGRGGGGVGGGSRALGWR